MYQLLSYLKFLVKSSNAHGIHSPFVFDFTTKCLCSRPHKSKNKTYDVLLKSTEYFRARNIKLIGDPKLQKQFKSEFPQISFSSQVNDIVYVENDFPGNWEDVLNLEELHNDSMVVFKGIYASPATTHMWLRLVSLEKITVSIDLYYCGLVFIRKEQVKQHFRIRI